MTLSSYYISCDGKICITIKPLIGLKLWNGMEKQNKPRVFYIDGFSEDGGMKHVEIL